MKLKITIIKADYYDEIADKYAIKNLGKCPHHQPGQVFYTDGTTKPEGLCRFAWEPMQEMVESLSKGELVQPHNTWLNDDRIGIFACVDGVRPVISLVEPVEE